MQQVPMLYLLSTVSFILSPPLPFLTSTAQHKPGEEQHECPQSQLIYHSRQSYWIWLEWSSFSS